MNKQSLIDVYNEGGVIAYPTEAVFGLGCDPDNFNAVRALLNIKKRPVEKGLILLAATYEQLLPYIDDAAIPANKRLAMLSQWPNGVTQVVPKNNKTPSWLTGRFDTIAVRLTNQVDVMRLCHQTGKPVVSTSANLSGQQPAKTWQEIENNADLANHVNYIIKGKTLGFEQPSIIMDALTGKVFRS